MFVLVAAGYVWAYNVQVYYEGLGRSPEEIGAYLAWIPMVGGSTSVVLGGIIADRVVIHRGPNARLVVIAISLVRVLQNFRNILLMKQNVMSHGMTTVIILSYWYVVQIIIPAAFSTGHGIQRW